MKSDWTAVRVPRRWADGRYVWFLGALPPALVYGSWHGVEQTGWPAFWWSGVVVTFMVIPLIDRLVGTSTTNHPRTSSHRWRRSAYSVGPLICSSSISIWR